MTEDLGGMSLLELFRLEAEAQTEALVAGLLALEKGAATPKTLEALMRAAHSLKGAARIVDLEAAVKIAHALEDCFVSAQKGRAAIGPNRVDALLRAVDLLTRISRFSEAEYEAWRAGADAELAEIEQGITGAGEPHATAPDLPALSAAPTPAPAPPEPAFTAADLEERPLDVPHSPAHPPASDHSAAPDHPPASDHHEDRVVRVSAASLSRLTGLAGESLVQSRRLAPVVNGLHALRTRQESLVELLKRGRDADDPLVQAAANCLEELRDQTDGLERLAWRGEDLSTRLHHEILAGRMRPISAGLKGFPKLVRDLAKRLGKVVNFVVEGESTGVDRDILDQLEAPLNHMIRNAIDHAIELPEERKARGKPEAGTIRIRAGHTAGMLQITIEDDGKGIDTRRLRSKVVERGLLPAQAAERLGEAELLEFLFLPGFSTRDAVTEVSGRGVGLDIVGNMARGVGGSVRIRTKPGKGSRFILQLPITLSVIRALLVEIAGEPFAFPLSRIERILKTPAGSIEDLEGRQLLVVEGEPLAIVSAASALGIDAPQAPVDPLCVVVIGDRARRRAIVVDRFLGERDLDVKPIDLRLGKIPNFGGASILDDGTPVLIFDGDDLARTIDRIVGDRSAARIEESGRSRAPRSLTRKRVLVVDDSITVRELERQILESHGYQVDIAVDGADGWNQVRSHDYQLVITDVDMPRMNGFELVGMIKRDPRLKTVPVVIVSYKEGEEHRMKGLDLGAAAYLTKSSFRDQTFLETVLDLIGEAKR